MPEWYEAGRVYLERNPNVSFGALLYSTIVLSGFVEFKRLNDIRNPGSQGSGILPEDFKGVGGPQGRTVGGPYVGGRFFDPMGLCRGSPEQTLKYKWNEVRRRRWRRQALQPGGSRGLGRARPLCWCSDCGGRGRCRERELITCTPRHPGPTAAAPQRPPGDDGFPGLCRPVRRHRQGPH